MRKIPKEEMKYIRKLVGNVTEEELRHVEVFVSEKLGIFIPSTGFCQYAIKENHTHPGYSFILYPFKQRNGRNNTYYELEVMSPNEPHQEELGEQFIRYIAIFIEKTYFEVHYKKYMQSECGIYHENIINVDKRLIFLIKEYMLEYENKALGYPQVLKNLTCIIMHLIIRSMQKDKEVECVSDKQVTEVAGDYDVILEHIQNRTIKLDIEYVLDYMNQHFNQQLSVEKLATLINQSKSHFTRCFKKETGKTPKEYLIDLRLQKTKRLLEVGECSITNIALDTGFNSAAHFSDCFTKHFGITPTAYKKLFQ